MREILFVIALSAMLPTCCGCLAMPNLAHPGTEEYQQARAKVFEPYPDNDMGPPVVGGRPREYQDPRPAFAVLQDMHPNPAAGPRPGEPILAPCPQPQVLQTPIAQPPIITPPPAIYTPPPAIYYPPGVTQP